MKPYQEEYIANIRAYEAITAARGAGDGSDLAVRQDQEEARRRELINRNMELLRNALMPQLDRMLEADEEEMEELRGFATALYDGRAEVDLGLAYSLHQTLLNLARQKEDRDGIIRELYWLGLCRYAFCSKLSGMPLQMIDPYLSQVRLCFTEAAAYLKYFEEIKNEDTRGYIMRSTANMAIGQFKTVSERTRRLKRALHIFQDPAYREMAPELPWERYVRQTRQLMIASLTFRREQAMSPQDVADIMESAHIVYRGKTRPEDVPLARQSFQLYSIEFYCGIYDMNTLLVKLEALMDQADTSDYSMEGMYSLISLPAFYSQYLSNWPEELSAARERYVNRLYRRIMGYVANCPRELENGRLFGYLRQLSHTFLETEHGIPYAEFLRVVIVRCLPEVYLRSWPVAAGGRALCEILLEEEPGFFDDMEDIRSLEEPEKKRRAVLEMAEQCGLFHDVGEIKCIDLYSRTVRQWFPEEFEIAQMHTAAGSEMLSIRPSTARLASTALGHHSWYDGSHSAPGGYKRLEHPERQMTDVIGLIDWLVDVTSANGLHTGPLKTFEEAADAAVALGGKQFSPLLTARLRIPEVVERLRQAIHQGMRDAYREVAATGK